MGTNYGSKYVIPMDSSAYIRLHTGTVLTNPGTVDAAKLELQGTAGVFTSSALDADVSGSYDGQYFLISSPSNTFCIWFKTTTTGVATQPSAAAATGYIPVEIASDASAITVATAIYDAMSGFPDFVITRTDDVLVFTSSHGGLHSIPDVTNFSTPGGTFTETIAPIGNWARLGLLAEDATFEPTPNKINTLEKIKVALNYTFTIGVNLINVNQRNMDILQDTYDGKECDIAFMNDSSSICPTLVASKINLDIFPNPFGGDAFQMTVEGERDYTDPKTYIKYWTYEMVYA